VGPSTCDHSSITLIKRHAEEEYSSDNDEEEASGGISGCFVGSLRAHI